MKVPNIKKEVSTALKPKERHITILLAQETKKPPKRYKRLKKKSNS